MWPPIWPVNMIGSNGLFQTRYETICQAANDRFRREPGTTWLMIDESEPQEETVARAMRLIDSFLSALDADEGHHAS